tara:strand:- start:57355 stop:57579 length:225 start_codon:yes stop_codon:yes gene_type:complete
MASLYLLIPVSLIFCALAVAIFFWAVNSGQYDDLDGEGERILFEDETDIDVSTAQRPQEKSPQEEQRNEIELGE